MANTLSFGVDPALATLLGDSYRSTERAIKELVDNAWDADASEVQITLPDQMTSDPIVIADDGSGMTVLELREDYLKVASDRRSRRGDRTKSKGRKVKGRKGIGKFAGLMVAESMQLRTKVRGVEAEMTFERAKLTESKSDFEKIRIPLLEINCDPEQHGTTIILRDLNRKLSHPSPDKLRMLLLADYGRVEDFKVFVNGTQATMKDIPGEPHDYADSLPRVGDVHLTFTLAEAKNGMRDSGILIKVDGKPIGDPTYFGLDEMDDVPKELLKRVYGEIEVGGLLDDVTADWGYVIENSLGYEEVKAYGQRKIREALEASFERDFRSLQARIEQQNLNG